MAGKTLVELQLETIKEWGKYRRSPEAHARKIKRIAQKHDPHAKIILFGSTARGEQKPDSDIDILIITGQAENTRERLKLRLEIAAEIGENTPFQIHIVTPLEYQNWYRKFIDKHTEI